VPIASLAAFLLGLIATAAERPGLDRRLHPGNPERRVYLQGFPARRLFVLDGIRHVLDDLPTTIVPPD
jgi:hypothetical protein